MVSEGGRLADIGTDHAYIPIALVKEGRISSAIAMDLREGPLRKAKANIIEEGLEERIETRLSDGLEHLKEGEADSILIAGLGGDLMIRMLKEGERLRETVQEYILSPHSQWAQVRRFLRKEGYLTIEERMIREEGKFYLAIKALPFGIENGINEDRRNTLLYDSFGLYLIKNKDQVLKEYLHKEYFQYNKILDGLRGRERSDSNHIDETLKKLREYLFLIKEAKNEIE